MRWRSSVEAAMIVWSLLVAGSGAVHLSPPAGAVFEGRVLDLPSGWGEARACLVWETAGVAECFRTEPAMDRRIAELTGSALPAVGGAAVATCSTSVRLYEHTGYSGAVLAVVDRARWINLSSYGFDNRTSSYRVGACPAYFADSVGGGGEWYPTSSTEAGDAASAMLSGWNDRVSSVYVG